VHEDDPNIVFLSSSLNNILVCGLLKGINICLMSYKDQEQRSVKAVEEVQWRSFTSVEILDPTIFEKINIKQI